MAHAVGWLQGSAEGAGLRTGPVGGWVYDHRRVLRIGPVVLASLALVFWGQPTGKVIIGLALALLVVLAIVQFLARPPQHTAVGSTPRPNRGPHAETGPRRPDLTASSPPASAS